MLTLPSGVTFIERGWLSSNNILFQDETMAVLIDSGYWTHAEQTHAGKILSMAAVVAYKC